MPLASQERVVGGLPIGSRFGRDSVAIRSRFGRDSVAIGRNRCTEDNEDNEDNEDEAQNVAKSRLRFFDFARVDGRNRSQSVAIRRSAWSQSVAIGRNRSRFGVQLGRNRSRFGVQLGRNRSRFGVLGASMVGIARNRSRFGRADASGDNEDQAPNTSRKLDFVFVFSACLVVLGASMPQATTKTRRRKRRNRSRLVAIGRNRSRFGRDLACFDASIRSRFGVLGASIRSRLVAIGSRLGRNRSQSVATMPQATAKTTKTRRKTSRKLDFVFVFSACLVVLGVPIGSRRCLRRRRRQGADGRDWVAIRS